MLVARGDAIYFILKILGPGFKGHLVLFDIDYSMVSLSSYIPRGRLTWVLFWMFGFTWMLLSKLDR